MDAIARPLQRAVTLSVNSESRTLLVEPRTHLADALREQLNLTGTHLGCEQGVCGACTVLIDGVPQRSCIAYAMDCEGSAVTTIEGFDGDATMGRLREAFSQHHALQCGFCTPGMLVTARDIVLRLGDVPEGRIREELAGNLCRCTGYVGIVAAVRAMAEGQAPQAAAAAVPATRLPPPAGEAWSAVAPLAESRTAPPAAVSAASASATPASATPASATPASAASGGTMLEERVHLAASPDVAWDALSDLRRVAACLPGAEIDELNGDHVSGRIAVALGPVTARFAGEGHFILDHAAQAGRLQGGGRDGSNRAAGEARWTVLPGAAGGSDLLVTLSWRLTGPLAQFGRGALVRDLVRRLARDFARNLDALSAGQAPPKAAPAGLLMLLWQLLKARLFGG